MKTWIIIIAVAFIIGSLVVISLGYYPVLRVNDEWVLQRTISERLASTEEVFARQGLEDAIATFEEQGGDFFLGVLESIIDEKLTLQEAEKVVDDIDKEIDRRVDNALTEIDIEDTIESAYGVPFELFREQVLIPGAVIDILRDEFSEEELVIKLENMRKTADIRVYFASYLWEDGFLAPVE